MTEFIGHFHPVLVHLPIGMLLLACLFLWMTGKEKYAQLRPALIITLVAGCVSALLSCISGYLLSLSGDYDRDLVGKHQNLALITTAISLLLLYLYGSGKKKIFSQMTGLSLFAGLLVTGHFGGTLTHGAGYLSSAFEAHAASNGVVKRKPIPDVQEALVYADLVQPLLQAKCYGCHGASKQKGKLRLDKDEFILRGGKDGKVILPGDALTSDLVKRILLPIDDDDHMPPKEKSQLKENDIALLHWWIEKGATFDKKVKDLQQPDSMQPVLLALQHAEGEEISKPDIPEMVVDPAPITSIQALQKRGVVILPVAQNSNYLMVNFASAEQITDEDLSILLPLKKQLVWVKLSGQQVGDGALPYLAQCENIYRLYLDHTHISDSGLKNLSSLSQLRMLNLVGTRVSSRGLMELRGLKKLRSLYLYQTAIVKSDWASLKNSFPAVRLDSGQYEVPVLESDTTLVKPPKSN